MATKEDNLSGHIRSIMNCLEIISGPSSLIITPDAIKQARKLVDEIPHLSGEDKFLVLTAARQLAESNLEEIDVNLSNNNRGSIVRCGITQSVLHSAKGEC